MANDNDANVCDHPGCSCPAAADSDYCSAYCESAGDETEVGCGCGHPGCASEIA